MGGKFLTDLKAGITFGALEIWLIAFIFMYYKNIY